MATEFEELKLQVTGEDMATDGLLRIRKELAGLTKEIVEQSDRLKKKSDEFGGQTRDFNTLAEQLGAAMGAFGRGLGYATVAATGASAAFSRKNGYLSDWVNKAIDVGNNAKMMCVNVGELKMIIDQLQRQGFTAQQSMSFVSGLSKTIADLVRPGSSVAEALIKGSDP